MKRLSIFTLLAFFFSTLAVQSVQAQLHGSLPIPVTGYYIQDFKTPINEGWQQSQLDDMNWTKNSGSTPSNTTGPSADYAGDNGDNYMYMEATGNFNKEAIIASPAFDLTALVNPSVEFYCHMEGTTMGTLYLEYKTSGSFFWQTLRTVDGDQGSDWERNTTFIDWIPNLNNIKFRFRGVTGNGFSSDIAIDYFKLTGNVSPKTVPLLSTSSLFEAKAFPNPFQDELTVQIQSDEAVSINLYNLQGQMVISPLEHVPAGSISIPTPDLPAGIYLLRVQSKHSTQTIRVVHP